MRLIYIVKSQVVASTMSTVYISLNLYLYLWFISAS